jgi:hypothetical protein
LQTALSELKHGSRFYVCADINEASLWQTIITMRLCGLMMQHDVTDYHELAGNSASISLIE